jgi:nucleoside phosphorylase
MICIVTAIFSEAKAFIELFELKKVQTKPFEVYQSDDITLVVSGMGKLKSAIATAYISTKKCCDRIYNIGICGTNSLEKEIGKLCRVRSIVEFETGKKYVVDNKGDVLYCFDRVVDRKKEKKELKRDILVDMESFGFYSAAIKFYTKDDIGVYKIVSDRLDTKDITNDFIYKIVKNAIKEFQW